jgi:hypothetical protein
LDAIIIRIIDLPETVKGFTVKDENDDYNVYINAKLSEDARADAWRHEIEHIRKDHFYNQMPVWEKEQEAKTAGRTKRTIRHAK